MSAALIMMIQSKFEIREIQIALEWCDWRQVHSEYECYEYAGICENGHGPTVA
jgi:hypothetical protein